MTKWVIERRHLEQEGDATPWERKQSGETLQEAVWHYNRLGMYLRCHEQRLLDPDGNLVLHHRDQNDKGPVDLSPPPWRDRWRDLLLPD